MVDETTNISPIKNDQVKPDRAPLPEPAAPLTAADRLRAFEDETLGHDAVRINGRIERGYGSFFQTKLTEEQRARHAALERLIETEQKVADAEGALAQAEADHAAAEAAADA